MRTIVGKSWECNWTLTLKAGQITVEGPFMDEGDSLFAVTGGTGKYAGAKGSMKLHPRDAKSIELRLHLRSTVVAYTLEHCLRSRQDFPALTKNPGLAFLDGPGGSQVPRVVVDAIADVYASCNVNTHGNFAPSREVDRRMAERRAASSPPFSARKAARAYRSVKA